MYNKPRQKVVVFCFLSQIFTIFVTKYNKMIVKQVHFGDDGQKKLKKGIKTIAGAVKSTLGARGRTVLIESENHVGGMTVTKDGVTVAKSINLYDPTENLAVMMMRQAAERTATVAGDGTTTSIVLAEAIIDASDKYLSETDNVTEVIREINQITGEIVQQLDKKSKKLSGKKLVDVATISANNDKEVGKMIADAFSEVDMVTVENSQTTSTYVEIIKGMKIDRGYSSRLFVNDFKKQECVLDNPYILISDHEINNIMNLEHIIVPIIQQKKSLLIIGELGQQAINTLNANVATGNLKACAIMPPSFGYRKKDLLEDLAVALGGVYFSEDTGDDLSLINLDHLGRANKVIVSNNTTVFMHNESREEDINQRVEELKEMRDLATNDDDKNFLNERIANLSGGVGVIYVGALSDIEQKEKKDRIDDAVCAVQAALEDGILPGGGVALLDTNVSVDYSSVAIFIMQHALQAPFKQIVENAGKNSDEILANRRYGLGYDVKGEQYGDMVKLGIIDPTKVTKNALLNAVSVATTIMSTNAIITNVRDYEGSK
jgi:chaperonin GroEL